TVAVRKPGLAQQLLALRRVVIRIIGHILVAEFQLADIGIVGTSRCAQQGQYLGTVNRMRGRAAYKFIVERWFVAPEVEILVLGGGCLPNSQILVLLDGLVLFRLQALEQIYV